MIEIGNHTQTMEIIFIRPHKEKSIMMIQLYILFGRTFGKFINQIEGPV